VTNIPTNTTDHPTSRKYLNFSYNKHCVEHNLLGTGNNTN